MTVSADLLRLGIVREATSGVTPENPAFQLLRLTSESLTFTAETQLSNELNPARQLADVILSGGASGGDVAFEISSNPGFELLLEGVLGNLWAGDVLTVGNRLLTHSIEKRFTFDANAVDPLQRYEYNRFNRAVVDGMSLTFSPGGPCTGTATMVGGQMARSAEDLAGATYLSSGQLPVMVGSGVMPIEFTIGATTFTAWCLSNLVVNFRNNSRSIICLGQSFATEVVLGRFEAEVTADIYINSGTAELMDAYLNGEEIAVKFATQDSLTNGYVFTFTRVRVANATEVAAGTNQDVIMSVTLQALVDAIAAPVVADTCVTIERDHASNPWPTLSQTEVRAQVQERARQMRVRPPREAVSDEVNA